MDWRKSTYSDSNGGSCVEVASTGWRKSTYSNSNGGECVETASASGLVLVRDTTNRAAATLTVNSTAWSTFTSALK